MPNAIGLIFCNRIIDIIAEIKSMYMIFPPIGACVDTGCDGRGASRSRVPADVSQAPRQPVLTCLWHCPEGFLRHQAIVPLGRHTAVHFSFAILLAILLVFPYITLVSYLRVVYSGRTQKANGTLVLTFAGLA